MGRGIRIKGSKYVQNPRPSDLPITGWVQGDGEEEAVYGESWVEPRLDHADKADWLWFWTLPLEPWNQHHLEVHGIRLSTLRRQGTIPSPVEVNGGPSMEVHHG